MFSIGRSPLLRQHTVPDCVATRSLCIPSTNAAASSLQSYALCTRAPTRVCTDARNHVIASAAVGDGPDELDLQQERLVIVAARGGKDLGSGGSAMFTAEDADTLISRLPVTESTKSIADLDYLTVRHRK